MSDLLADPQKVIEASWLHTVWRRHFRSEVKACVSVIIATRNNEDTLEEAIGSILGQSMPPLEVIVIDDASDDRSWRIIQDCANADPRIRPIRNDNQMGTGWSRNLGLSSAQGDFVTFQDGDDTSNFYRLEKQYQALVRAPGKKLVTCNYVRVNEKGRTIRINDRRTMKCIISMMFPRSEVLEKVGFFRHESVSEDADYYERIKAAFGVRCEVTVFRTLYKALFRPSSSYFTTVQITGYDGSHLLVERKAEALEQWQMLTADHKQMIAGARTPYVPFRDMSHIEPAE